MRYFIAVLFMLYFYSPSLYAKKAKNDTVLQKIDKTLYNFSKKQRNSLKTDLFSDQINLLHQSGKNNSLLAIHFTKLLQGSPIHFSNINFITVFNTRFHYNFIYQYLYPKHSFW